MSTTSDFSELDGEATIAVRLTVAETLLLREALQSRLDQLEPRAREADFDHDSEAGAIFGSLCDIKRIVDETLTTAVVEKRIGYSLKYRIGEDLYWVGSGDRAGVLEYNEDDHCYIVESDMDEELNARIRADEDDLTRNSDGTPDDD